MQKCTLPRSGSVKPRCTTSARYLNRWHTVHRSVVFAGSVHCVSKALRLEVGRPVTAGQTCSSRVAWTPFCRDYRLDSGRTYRRGTEPCCRRNPSAPVSPRSPRLDSERRSRPCPVLRSTPRCPRSCTWHSQACREQGRRSLWDRGDHVPPIFGPGDMITNVPPIFLE